MKYSDYLSNTKFPIFLFHGVVAKDDYKIRNYTRKHLTVGYFYKVLQDLKNKGNPVSMDDIMKHDCPPNSFAVTFDDGFYNNYSLAAPILVELRIPATFYVTSSFVDQNSMSWIDRIEYSFEENKLTNKKELDYIRSKVKADSHTNPNAYADSFTSIISSDDPLDKKMSWQDVKELSEKFTIGGHTHTHPIMSYLNDDELDAEIELPLAFLKKIGIHTQHFSYPEGLDYCYNDKVIKRLKHYGIKICPTAISGLNTTKTDLFNLKRIMVV